jgi:glyoxylase-like metal-dependent hydrolase (beta-lactamase superfamily II)
MKTTILHPATFKLDGGAMFGIIPKPLWEKKIKPDEFNRINMSLRVVLFQTKNRNILIDTGIGDYHGDKFNGQFDVKGNNSPLVSCLAELNLTADDITDIIITHLHFDHVGGLGQGEHGTGIIFKNATLHVHKDHLEYSQNATLRDAGSFHTKTFLPLIDFYKVENQLNLVEGHDGLIIVDEGEEVRFKTSFGHTPYMIHPYNNEYIYMADLVPMGHHLHIPWVMGYDIEPGTTTEYKLKFYDFIAKENLKMIFEHDNEIIGGNIAFDEKNRPKLENVIVSIKDSIQSLN